jgi:ribonuclease HII
MAKIKTTELERFSYDENIRQLHGVFCGIDEAGRGPLAGDVYAAAVILDPDNKIEGINDSKKISEKKREILYPEIMEKAIAVSVGIATVEEIENINILNAALLAMKRAFDGLEVKPEFALIDGNKIPPELGIEAEYLIGGDAISASIGAASVIAKVERDRSMRKMAELYPEYGFEKHKGYGTKQHREAILQYGPLPVHRMSFLKKILK